MSKWQIALFLLFVLFLVVPILQLIMKELTFAGNATHAPGMITQATNTSAGTDGPFVQAFFEFWPMLLAVICIAVLFGLIGKRINPNIINLGGGGKGE